MSRSRTYGQIFTPPMKGVVREVELRAQTLNAGENAGLWVAILNVAHGMPVGHPLAESVVPQLVPGWGTYHVDFSRAKLALTPGTPYALRIRSAAPTMPQHTLAFDAAGAGGAVGPLWVASGETWVSATTVGLESGAALYFSVVTCR